ncbi:hypothetical protein K2173_013439 [Erythroxylum novogranatense]|uniref:Thioesterase domain-containing protein n=1 Tax=Erythroxylum novogranatense TaxID=1862640 RepID=A0AAV8SA95_9ROSI|nr:hypothetical protein K2173_013439 [Erythroxylum novogranatense]
MCKTPPPSSSSATTVLNSSSEQTSTVISKELNPKYAATVKGFMVGVGVTDSAIADYKSKGFFDDMIRDLLTADLVQGGRVSCSFSVLPFITNYFKGVHGGAVGAIAERVSTACARTVVAEDKQLFLGELSISYLSAAATNEEVVVDASVVRSGRNLTVVAMEFRIKNTKKLVYTARATFYHLPSANL